METSWKFPIFFHIKPEKMEMFITFLQIMKMTSNLVTSKISRKETFSESFMKN